MEWISLEEKQPELGSRVLIGNAIEGWTDISILCDEYTGTPEPVKVWLYGNKGYPYQRVTHWMEIPKILGGTSE
jgi:hypothetical protein